MKRLLLIIAMMIPLVSFAQNTKRTSTTSVRNNVSAKPVELPGLKVYGIGFETTRKRYEQELSKKGYTKPSKFSNYDEYIVDFAGYKDCKFEVHYNVNTDSITSISVTFPYETYRQNSDAHIEIVRQLDAKYGKSESKDETSEIWKKLGMFDRGLVENRWVVNGVAINAAFLWNSSSNKVGDNSFSLYYYTKASKSTAIKANDDL